MFREHARAAHKFSQLCQEEEDRVRESEDNFLEFSGFCTNCAMTPCVCMMVKLEAKLAILRKEKEEKTTPKENWQPKEEDFVENNDREKKRKREEEKNRAPNQNQNHLPKQRAQF